MAYYRIGPLSVSMEEAPESWQSFQTRDLAEPLLRVERTASPVDLTGWRCLETQETLDVWRQEDLSAGWLFQEQIHGGWMWVSRDYAAALLYDDDAGRRSFPRLLFGAAECALIWNGSGVLHAACVLQEGEAVAFSAPSGSGKSTRAARWKELFSAVLLSGDRPIIDPGTRRAYGAPWDGKEQAFVNASAPLRGILEVRRASRTELRRMTEAQAGAFLSGQLLIPMWDTQLAARALSCMRQIIRRVPLYLLYSDQDEQSARTTHQILFRTPEQIKYDKEEPAMKLKPGFEIVEIDGDYLALPTGDNVAAFAGSVVLNEVSATLLRELAARACTRENLLELLLNEYEVEAEVASRDLDNILKTFAEIGLIEE